MPLSAVQSTNRTDLGLKGLTSQSLFLPKKFPPPHERMLSHTSPGAASRSQMPRGRLVPTALPALLLDTARRLQPFARPTESATWSAPSWKRGSGASPQLQHILRVTRRSTPPKNNDPSHGEAFLPSLLPPKPCGCEGKQKKGSSTFIAERDRSGGARRTMGVSGAGGDPRAAAAPAPLGPQRPVCPPELRPMPRYLRGHLPDFRSAGGTLAREATARRRCRTTPGWACLEPDGGQNFLPRNDRAFPHLRHARAAAGGWGCGAATASPHRAAAPDGRAARSPTPPRLPPTGVRNPRHAPAPRGRWGRLPSGGRRRRAALPAAPACAGCPARPWRRSAGRPRRTAPSPRAAPHPCSCRALTSRLRPLAASGHVARRVVHLGNLQRRRRGSPEDRAEFPHTRSAAVTAPRSGAPTRGPGGPLVPGRSSATAGEDPRQASPRPRGARFCAQPPQHFRPRRPPPGPCHSNTLRDYEPGNRVKLAVLPAQSFVCTSG